MDKCQMNISCCFISKQTLWGYIHLNNSLLPEKGGFDGWHLIIHVAILAECHADVNLLFFLIRLTFKRQKRANIYMCED